MASRRSRVRTPPAPPKTRPTGQSNRKARPGKNREGRGFEPRRLHQRHARQVQSNRKARPGKNREGRGFEPRRLHQRHARQVQSNRKARPGKNREGHGFEPRRLRQRHARQVRSNRKARPGKNREGRGFEPRRPQRHARQVQSNRKARPGKNREGRGFEPDPSPQTDESNALHGIHSRSESTGRFYIGQTKNLEERLAYHNANYSKALRNRGPWQLAYTESYSTRSEAVKRERYIKIQKSRAFIQALLSASR